MERRAAPAEDVWKRERARHPFAGEGLSEARIAEMWDRAAPAYGGGALSGLATRITERMSELGLLRPGSAVADVGCGPGTFALGFSELCGEVVCIDSSPAMLARLRSEARRRGVENIRIAECSWESYAPDRRFDTVFTSLCPPMGSPGAVLKMESCSKGWCAYVSSMDGGEGSLHMEVWRALGRDYSLGGASAEHPKRFLEGLGREPRLEVFESRRRAEVPAEEAAESERRRFSMYMPVGPEVSEAIDSAVAGRAEDGVVRTDAVMRFGLLTWRAPPIGRPRGPCS